MDKIGDDCSCCQHILPFNYFSPYHYCQSCLSCTDIGGVDQWEGQPLGSTEEIEIIEDQPSNDEKSSGEQNGTRLQIEGIARNFPKIGRTSDKTDKFRGEVTTGKSILEKSSEGETSTSGNKKPRGEEMPLVASILPIRFPLPSKPAPVPKKREGKKEESKPQELGTEVSRGYQPYDQESKSEVTTPPFERHESGVMSLVGAITVMVMTPPLSVSALGGDTDQKAYLIQTAFLTTAINSILQVWFGDRLPVIMQQSRNFTFSGLAVAVSSGRRYRRASYSKIGSPVGLNNQNFEESIKRIQGVTIIGAISQIIFGFSSGGAKFARHISPLVMVPFISLSGFRIFTTGFSVLASCNIQLGLPALVLLVFSTQYLPGMWKSKKKLLEEYSVTICAALLWIYAEILILSGAYDGDASYRSQGTNFRCDSYSGVLEAAPWIKIPRPFPYGGPIFEVDDVFLIMAASFVDAIESTGTNIAASRLAGARPITPSALSRGIGWQGIGNLVNAIFGSASGSSSSAEQAGFVGLTQVGSRRIILVSAIFMLVFSMIGKLGAFVALIPLPIQAALQMALIPIFGSTGLDYLQFCNMNSFRSLFILGISFFVGLSVPQYFYQYELLSDKDPVHTNSKWFNDAVKIIFSSPTTVGVVVAFVLDRTHTPNDSSTKNDNGWELKNMWYKKSDSTYSVVSSVKELVS